MSRIGIPCWDKSAEQAKSFIGSPEEAEKIDNSIIYSKLMGWEQ